jgi:transcription antitermination protein NusB
MPRLRLETRARARALQALYAWDLRDGEPLEQVASQVWDDLAIAPDQRALAGPIVNTIIAEGKSIDDALRDVTTNWRLERVGAVERAVLRVAAAELLRGEPPPRVTIQEAVWLAERYGSTQSARFVNGVLDALARRMGRL